MKTTVRIILALVMSLSLDFAPSLAADMDDYCIVPPFIQENAKPNLLMIIDNSASMYDLAYVDRGKKHCSVSTGKSCFFDADCYYCSVTTGTKCTPETVRTDCPGATETCVSAETCSVFDRQPQYCYDQTYRRSDTYLGYFNKFKSDGVTKQYYRYDFSSGTSNGKFDPVNPNNAVAAAGDYSCTAAAGQTKKEIANEMCLIYDPSRSPTDQVVGILASGNYLNWLTTSKFDLEKKILTGGKYVSGLMLGETRGCVGQGYLKDALTTDFVNYNDGVINPNTQLGLTFRVKGPPNDFNPVASSIGGDTFLDIFAGSKPYDHEVCNKAIVDIATGGNADIKKSVDDCLQNTTPVSGSCAQNGQACVTSYFDPANPGTTTPNCDNPIVTQHCQNGPLDKLCTDPMYTGGSCVIAGSNSCTNLSTPRACTVASDCDEKLCKKDDGTFTSVACSTVGSTVGCVQAEIMGTCSKGSGTCRVAGDCSNKQALCNGYVAGVNNGTCAQKSPGVCQNVGNLDLGPCVAAGGGYVGPCILPSGAAVVKTKVAFQQNMQECWKIRGTVQTAPMYGFSNMNTIKNQCPEIYGSYMSCSNNKQKQCTVATQATDCGAGNSCLAGPAAIGPGNPALLCGNQFAGAYYNQASPYALWGTDEQLAAAQYQFCLSMQAPDVTDPSDAPSNNQISEGLPAILSGLGIESQLGQPIAQNIRARVSAANEPQGLIHEYKDKIRMGVMSFNNYGSAYEVANMSTLAAATNLNRVTATKLCSSASPAAGIPCKSEFDCGGTTGATSYCQTTGDKDGAVIASETLIGHGRCSIDTTIECTKKAHCPGTETCVPTGIGNHSAGLVNKVGALRAGAWTPFSEAFYNAVGYFAMDPSDTTGKTSRTDLRLNSTDFPDAMNPSEYPCQANNVLLITDGGSTADLNSSVTGVVNTYKAASGNVTGACSYFQGSQNLDDLTWLARNRNINTFSKTAASTAKPVDKNQFITTYVVSNGPDNGQTGECNNIALLNQAASKGGTALLKTDIPEQYEDTLRRAFSAVAGGTASGTAASILSNSEGSGANILQAVFYPYKEFESVKDPVTGISTPTSTTWIGEMQNLWYYVDPYVGNSSVREDTAYTTGDHTLNLISDYQVEFFFDPRTNDTRARLKKDANADGLGEVQVTSAMDTRVQDQAYCSVTTSQACSSTAPCPTGESCVPSTFVSADDVGSIWRAGKLLWNRDVTTVAGKRKLYTYLKGSVAGGKTFTTEGLIDLVSDFDGLPADDKFIIQTYLQAASLEDAKNIIKYTQGDDNAVISGVTTIRNRKVKLTSGGTTATKEWKLGDIISSTPRVQSSGKLNNYHLDPPAGYSDLTYANDGANSGYANSSAYKSRGMVYAGANDGLLHAFNMGVLTVKSQGAQLATLSGSDLGEERWAFIPKNVLPYLKYLADSEYNHLYLVDGTTKIVDASVGHNDADAANYPGCSATEYWKCKRDNAKDNNKSWRTILIGSMGIGGASRNFGDATCVDKLASGSCVKTPVPDVGMSSYFALDITDPTNPSFLWEFSDETLGYSTSGAAVARVSHKKDDGTVAKGANGRWYAVLGNGPSGPIDNEKKQFKGKSDKPLKVFVLDLKYGASNSMKYELAPATAINNAFVGSISNAPIDTDRWSKLAKGSYSDDALYFGYANCEADCDTLNPTWDGGVMRLRTFENPLPSQWSLTQMIKGTGPVTASISRLQDKKYHNLWLFFGSGRYYFKDDDKSASRKLFGLREPCYRMDNTLDNSTTSTCAATIDFAAGGFSDQTTSISAVDKGWYIDMDPEDTDNVLGAERVITDPVAMPNGAVFFTTFKPSTDICKFGGNSYMWGVKYDTGGTAAANTLKGKALVQVSTGSFEEIDISTALTASLGRKMGTPMVGKPPNDPPPIVSPSMNKPLKRIIHIQER